MKTGKITATNKQLESHDIPDRFYKRMEVCIFGEINKRKIPIRYSNLLCSCHDFFYICGDIEDDEYRYVIPKDWIELKIEQDEKLQD